MIHAIEYHSYHNAKQRCTNPNHPRYKDWGGRGIEFKFKSFTEFLQCLGPRPVKHSLDRIDNNGHYEVSNVQWTTYENQNLNQRLRKDNKSSIKNLSYNEQTDRWSFKFKNKRLFYGISFGDALATKLLYMETLN